jgi:Uma2 family endonuclease
MNTVQVKRFTLSEYQKLAELGFFDEDSHIELINGEIVQMAAKGTIHETCLRKLLKQLPRLVGDRATLQSQAPISLTPNSEPEPDFSIIKNRDDDYLYNHPEADDILLVMEVSDSSLDYDQNVKLSLYAKSEIAHYWIFNLVDNYLEVYSEPYQNNQGKYGYLNKRICLSNQTISFSFYPEFSLDLSKIFPDFNAPNNTDQIP